MKPKSILTVACMAMILFGTPVWAADAPAKQGEADARAAEESGEQTELAKKSQNPIADLISLPLQYNVGFNVGPYDRVQSILNIQPVIPVRLTEDWNLITRTILPLIKQPVLTPEVTQVESQTIVTYPDKSVSGMGDLNLSMFLSPAKPGRLIWGVGPILSFPTANKEELGTEKFSLGPTGVVLAMQGPWVFGGLVNQVWSVTGDEKRRSVSQMLIQPFVNYNFKGGWFLSASPIITANWMAHGNNRWIVPLGGGGGRVFMVGKQPVNAAVQAFYHVARPDFGPEWSLRFQVSLLFPK